MEVSTLVVGVIVIIGVNSVLISSEYISQNSLFIINTSYFLVFLYQTNNLHFVLYTCII